MEQSLRSQINRMSRMRRVIRRCLVTTLLAWAVLLLLHTVFHHLSAHYHKESNHAYMKEQFPIKKHTVNQSKRSKAFSDVMELPLQKVTMLPVLVRNDIKNEKTLSHNFTKNEVIKEGSRDQSNNIEPKAAKVLFLTYSRSGSSFLGEVINRNKNGFYHFEPLLGTYSALYAIPFGMKSMAFFRYKNGTDRWPPLFEYEAIAQQLVDLFSCNIDRLPVEMLQDRFVMILNKEQKYAPYKKCLKETKPEIVKPRQSRVLLQKRRKRNTKNSVKEKAKPKSSSNFTAAHICTNLIRKQCGSFFDGKREFQCFNHVFKRNYPETEADIRDYLYNTKPYVPVINRNHTNDTFQSHNTCILEAQNKSSGCVNKLQAPCTQSTIRGAKVIRMRMENVVFLLEKDPTIKIIHYFRDPRGLELSRSVGMRGDKQKTMIKDSQFTCHKMSQDIAARKELEKGYPNNFMVLKYEDLALDTMATAKKIYGFLGIDIPEEVYWWLHNNTQKSSDKKQSRLSTSNHNSTATALRWKSSLPESTIFEIGRICENVLHELAYK